MANTTSTLLQIVDMEEGANNDSWGPIADANWTKLENAIANQSTINSTGGTYSLSDDENRSSSLKITGTLASNLIIETKARLKWWIIDDQTTRGAYTVTIKAAGGTAISVPAGRAHVFWCDGTEVYAITPGSDILDPDADDALYGYASGDIRGKIGGTDIFKMTSAGLTMLNSKVLTGAWAYMPSASGLLFYNSTAPTGWTKSTSINNHALRIVSGTGGVTGGTVDFSTAFASQSVSGTVGATTLTTSQVPAMTYSCLIPNTSYVVATGASVVALAGTNTSASGYTKTGLLSDNGGGGSHNHTFSGTAINLAVKYADFILCTKDA